MGGTPVEIKVAVITGVVTLLVGVPNAIAAFHKSPAPTHKGAAVKHAAAGTATPSEAGLASCVTIHERALAFVDAQPRLRARYAISGDGDTQGLARLNSRAEESRCGSSERLIEADAATPSR